MNQTVLSLLVGLLGATLGVVVTLFFVGTRRTDDTHGYETSDLAALRARLDRLEGAEAAPTLRGVTAPEGSALAGGGGADLDALLARLEERLKPLIDERVSDALDCPPAGALPPLRADEPEQEPTPLKKMSLAEAAVELELSAEEEADLRHAIQATTTDLLKILAGSSGNVSEVRREFEEAKADSAKQEALADKYVPRYLKNVAGLMGIMLLHERRVAKAIGLKKADRLKWELDVEDLDPLGLETLIDFD